MSLFRPPAYSHGDRVEAAGHVLRLSVNARARRISLRVDRTRREVVATAPSARRLGEAVAFARERIGWIEAQLADLPAPKPVAPGMAVELFGRPFTLVARPGRARIDLDAGTIAAPDDAAFADRVLRLIKGEARRRFTEMTAGYAATLGAPVPAVSVIDAKARWGSCTPARAAKPASIRYSWRLALAPLAVADYVAAHECAHLVEANHGPRFWALVDRLYGDPAPHRAWLRAHGTGLHAFGR
ncbi:MAG TPA: SprT family zinc-dependent metalloprotease [Caulobacter sp.]|nr:SprT family zinc-dependent metalloprotease [Caulobacter sp.]